jgi:hypothetical protein
LRIAARLSASISSMAGRINSFDEAGGFPIVRT